MTRFTWDDEDRLASTTLPDGHTDGNAYTGLGMRLSKTDGGVGYAYLCDGVSPASPVLSDGQLSFTPGISQTLGTPNGSGGMSYASHFYAEDAVGNLRGMSDAGAQGFPDAYNWDAFGQLIGRAGGTSTPFGYGEASGSQADGDSGLRLLGHRYYDSRTGRFISQDPAGDGDNWYAYADNDPIDETDPYGLDPQDGVPGTLPGYDPNNPATNIFNPGTAPEIKISVGVPSPLIVPAAGATSSTDFSSTHILGGVGGFVDNWVTFGTVTHAGQVAGAYDSGHASRGAAFGAGALAVGAILAAGASGGRDVAEVDTARSIGVWGKGTFETVEKSLAYHFEKHGEEVGAESLLQYLRKAEGFNQNLRGATKSVLDNAIRHSKNGKYIIKDLEGKILSFGGIR